MGGCVVVVDWFEVWAWYVGFCFFWDVYFFLGNIFVVNGGNVMCWVVV